MGKQAVVKCQCERCLRVWYEDAGSSEEGASTSVDFLWGNDQVSVSFSLLCTPCAKTVRNYISSILKEPKVPDVSDDAVTVLKG